MLYLGRDQSRRIRAVSAWARPHGVIRIAQSVLFGVFVIILGVFVIILFVRPSGLLGMERR